MPQSDRAELGFVVALSCQRSCDHAAPPLLATRWGLLGLASDLSCARKTFDGRIGYRECAIVRRGVGANKPPTGVCAADGRSVGGLFARTAPSSFLYAWSRRRSVFVA